MTMERTDFLSIYHSVHRLHPGWFDLPSDNRADPTLLADAEDALGAKLPSDFRWFLEEFGGGDFAFAAIYSVDPASDLNICENQPDESPGAIAFSDDGTGNFYVFLVQWTSCEDRVLLLDHESGRLRETEYSGFLDFAARVALRSDA